MQAAATKTLWWGIGLFILGGAALILMPWLVTGIESAVNFNTVDRTIYFGLISPISVIIQYGVFPLGAALIAGSVVIRHINRWVIPTKHSADHTPSSENHAGH